MKDADVFFRERYAVWQETSAFIYSNINTSDVVGNLCVPLPKPGLGLRSGLFEQAAQCGPICPNVDMASSIIWEYPDVCYAKLLQLWPTPCASRDWSSPGSSVHGILQATILEWIAMPSPRGSSPTQGSNPCLLHLLNLQVGSLPLAPPDKPTL